MASSVEKVKGMNGRHHVMLLPSLGRGHLIPFMQLANKLAARGFTVTFVVTFHHTSALQKKVESARENGLDIRLVEMEIPKNQLDTVHWDDQRLPSLAANESLEGPFERFLQRFMAGEICNTSESPGPRLSCLIADFLLGWASGVAKKFDIRRVCFDTCGMYAESICQIVWKVLPRNLPRTLSGRCVVPGLPKDVHLTSLQMLPELSEVTAGSAIHQLLIRMREGNKQSWRTIANTFYDLERDFVEHFAKNYDNMRAIGPLLPPKAF